MRLSFTLLSRTIIGLVVAVGFVFAGNSAQAGNPIHTNCLGTHCVIDAIWQIFRNSDVNNPLVQDAVTTMNTDTAIVQSGIKNQLNQTSVFLPGDKLTVPINASGELISTGAQFYDSPPVYFDAGGAFRAIMQNVASCQSVAGTLESSLTNFTGNFNNCLNSAPDNSPITGTWSDEWTTSAGAKLTCATNAGGTTATCTSSATLLPGQQTITLTRTVKDLQWSARDVWLNRTGMPTMNLHPFYSTYGYTYLFSGWDTLHDAPMTSSATVNFVIPQKPTVDITVAAASAGPFSNGPITIPTNTQAYLRWTSTNASSCSITGAMTASGLPSSGLNYPTANLTNATNTYNITCTGPGGTSAPDSVTVLTGATPPTPTPCIGSCPTPSPTPSPTPTLTPTPTPCIGVCPTVTPNPATPTPSFGSGGFQETR